MPFSNLFVKKVVQDLTSGGLLGVWDKWMKHAKYIYNIQDFNPEQVLAVGYTKSKLITDAMMWFDKFSCKRSDLVITVGRDLVETVENRFKDKKVPKTVMINNWIDVCYEISDFQTPNEGTCFTVTSPVLEDGSLRVDVVANYIIDDDLGVSDALNAVKTKIGETKAEADKFNGALKSQRDVNTYIKSVSNSLYTAQRYLSNNSKITTDPAIYARYLEYIERYQELLKSGKITQQNGQEYASEASKEFAELKKAVQDAGLETDTLAMKFKKLFETNIKSQFASQVINMVEQGLRQIYQNVVNIDSAMTELKKVTNETDNTYDAFLDDAGTRAKNLGASISDIVTASADFARLGYNLKDSKELADAAVLYQHVGDGISSVNDASESIISTMKAFGVEAKDVTSIVDKFNEVGNNYAISSAGVGSALQRSASALHTAGNTLDQSIGMIVAANDVAQDPESVGNALKVLSLRIRGAKTDLEQMGESTDDVAVSTSKLREQIKALTNVDGKGGFDILTKSGDFKSTYEIMEGIANVWKEMNDVDKASLLEQVAGKNRANIVSGMLDNWKDAQNAAKTAAESAGSATKENETYLDSINGKISQFTAAFEKLSKDVLDSDLIKFFIELATHIANLADEAVKLVDNIGLIPTAIGGIGAALGVSLIKNKGTSGKLYARLHKGNSCVGCRCQIIKYPNCWERLRAA